MIWFSGNIVSLPNMGRLAAANLMPNLNNSDVDQVFKLRELDLSVTERQNAVWMERTITNPTTTIDGSLFPMLEKLSLKWYRNFLTTLDL